MPSYRVLQYGATEPTPQTLLFMEQELRLRHKLWNQLVEIEQDIRRRARELIRPPEIEAELKALDEQIEHILAEIRARRSAQRSRAKVDISDLKALLNEAKARKKDALARAKAMRDEVKARNKAKLDDLEQERRMLVKHAYNSIGLYWGNYNSVLANYKVARVRAMREGAELKFKRWNGEGKISVLFSSDPEPTKDGVCNTSRLVIDPVDPQAWLSPVRSVRRHSCFTRARMRVGSIPGTRQPIWVEFGVAMHRPLPEGRIREAHLVRRKCGWTYGKVKKINWQYRLVVVVEVPDVQPRETGKTVAVDIGWRKVPDGIRVAYWVDDEGNHGECVIPERLVGCFAKLHELDSLVSNIFNERRAAILASLPAECPDWMMQDQKTMKSWRSAERFYRFCRHWTANRFPGDEIAFEHASCYMERFEHLAGGWRDHLRQQILGQRLDIYRTFAKRVLHDAQRLILEDFDLRPFSRKSTEAETDDGFLRSIRFIAAPSELRQALLNYCGREGVAVEKMPSAHTTKECHACGYIGEWDAAESLMHRCERCGALWDQDYNACANLLKRWGSARVAGV